MMFQAPSLALHQFRRSSALPSSTWEMLFDEDFYHSIRHEKDVETPVVQPNSMYASDQQGATLTVELPGVQKKDIQLVVEGSKLTITGKRYREVDQVTSAKRIRLNDKEEEGETRKDANQTENKEQVEKVEEPSEKANQSNDAGNTVNAQKEVTVSEPKEHVEEVETDRQKNAPRKGDDANVEEEEKRHLHKVYKGTFRLNRRVDVDGIEVENMRDGVLTLRMPNRKDVVRKIAVQ